MAQPTNTQVHIDAALSNISIAYKNPKYIADALFPAINVSKESDYYFTFDKDFWFRNHVQRRGPSAGYEQGGFTVSKTQYVCVNKGLAFPLPYETVKNADAAIDLERTGAEWLADQFLLDREITLAARILGASAWTSSTTLSGTTQWSDYENSDPIGDVETGRQTIQKLTGLTPNVGLMGTEVFAKVRRHPDLLDIYKYTEKGILSVDQVGAALQIPKLLIGDSVYNSSDEGQTFSGSYIWGKYCLLLYVAPNPGLRQASAGYTFLWLQNGYTVPLAKVADPMHRQDVLQGDCAYDQKVVGADCGYEIITAVA